MRIRPLPIIGTFAAAVVLMAGHAQPARAHVGDTLGPGVIHACVGSFGGIRIVGVNSTCAATETPLHWSPADRPTTLAAEQNATVTAVGGAPTVPIPGASITFTLSSPATIDIKADGAVQLDSLGQTRACSFVMGVDASIETVRNVEDVGAGQFVNWSAQRNGVSLAAGTHTISLALRASGSGGVGECRQLVSTSTRAKLWVLVR